MSDLDSALRDYHALTGVTGWEAACLRGERVDALLIAALGQVSGDRGADGLDLLLRGSGGQGIPSTRSDIDFELSGHGHPHGHLGWEDSIVVLLRDADICAEGSAGRPRHTDLVGGVGHTRDLHEWSELRRAGSAARDVGWLAAQFASAADRWWTCQSAHERLGRQPTAKYAFFEARALVSRLAARAGAPVAATPAQLAWLADAELTELVQLSLDRYESEDDNPLQLKEIQDALQSARARHGLPGPQLEG